MTWHTVHHGSPDSVNLASGFLDGFGIALRVVDPHDVEVPRDRVTSASSALRVQVREPDTGTAAGLLADAATEPRPATVDRSLDRLGLSIRGCAMSTFFAPLGVVLAQAYLTRAARAADRPSEHGWTLAGIAVCALMTALWATVWAMG